MLSIRPPVDSWLLVVKVWGVEGFMRILDCVGTDAVGPLLSMGHMCMCACVRACTCAHTHMCVDACERMCISMHACTHVCLPACACVVVFVCMCTHVCVLALCACMCALHTCTRVYVCACTCMCARMCVCTVCRTGHAQQTRSTHMQPRNRVRSLFGFSHSITLVNVRGSNSETWSGSRTC